MEHNREFASVHMNESVSSTPAILLVVPGVPMNGNEFPDLCVLIIAGDNPDPHLQRKELKTNPELPRPHSGTPFVEVIDTEEEDNDGSGDNH